MQITASLSLCAAFPDPWAAQGPVVKDSKVVARMNAGFIEFVVTPLWRALHEFFPELDVCMSAFCSLAVAFPAGPLSSSPDLTRTARCASRAHRREPRVLAQRGARGSLVRRRRQHRGASSRGRGVGGGFTVKASEQAQPGEPVGPARRRPANHSVPAMWALQGCLALCPRSLFAMEGSNAITAHLALVPSRTCYVALPAPARALVVDKGVRGHGGARAARSGC